MICRLGSYRDFERLPQVLASLHFVVFNILIRLKAAAVMAATGSL
jgi:hypothetical protein